MRGLGLILVDAIIMGLPRALTGFYSFMVLTSIGVAIIAMALLRDVPNNVLVPLLAMVWPCAWYYRTKKERPNFITRYV